MKVLNILKDPVPVVRHRVQKIGVSRFFRDSLFIDPSDPLYGEGGELFGKYVPVKFAVVFRTVYTNLVLESESDGAKKYYTSLGVYENPAFRNITEYNSSELLDIMVMDAFNRNAELDLSDNAVIQFLGMSVLQLWGMYNPDPGVCDPTVVLCVLMPDSPTVNVLPRFLKDGRKLVPISDIDYHGNIGAILDKIVEVRNVQS